MSAVAPLSTSRRTRARSDSSTSLITRLLLRLARPQSCAGSLPPPSGWSAPRAAPGPASTLVPHGQSDPGAGGPHRGKNFVPEGATPPLDQPLPQGVRHRVGAVAELEAGDDVLDDVLDRAFRVAELAGDLGRVAALG